MTEETRGPHPALAAAAEEEPALNVPLVAAPGGPMLLWLVTVLPSVLFVFGSAALGLPSPLGTVLGVALVAASTVLATWLTVHTYGSSVTVGADGILVGSRVSHRLIPYDQIASVDHVLPLAEGRRTQRLTCRVDLTLTTGELVQLPTRHYRGGPRGDFADGPALADATDPVGSALVRTIERRRQAWSTRTPYALAHEAAVARGGRTGSAWLDALRRLAAGTADAYRATIVDRDQLWALLDDPAARPAARAAAAVALGTSDPARPRERLRIAADALADPKTRVALHRIADATDDAALTEALSALQEEGARPGRTTKRRWR